MTLKEFYPQYKKHKEKTCKISTVSAYMLICKNHILPQLGDYELQDISSKEAEMLKSSLEERGLSKKSICDIIIVLKNILRIAEYLEVAATKKISVLWSTDNNERRPTVEAYNKEQVRKLVEKLEEEPSFQNLGILLTIYSGMRIGEVCGLQWNNVDLEEKIIKVRQTIQRIYIEDEETGKSRTEVLVSTPKTSSSQRDIPMSPKIYRIMKDYSRIIKPDYYVCSGSVKPIEPRTYRNYYKKILEECGLPKLKFHGLRHTFATQMLSARSDVKVLSSILGHHSINTTLDIYVHPSQEDKRNAISRLKF